MRMGIMRRGRDGTRFLYFGLLPARYTKLEIVALVWTGWLLGMG